MEFFDAELCAVEFLLRKFAPCSATNEFSAAKFSVCAIKLEFCASNAESFTSAELCAEIKFRDAGMKLCPLAEFIDAELCSIKFSLLAFALSSKLAASPTLMSSCAASFCKIKFSRAVSHAVSAQNSARAAP